MSNIAVGKFRLQYLYLQMLNEGSTWDTSSDEQRDQFSWEEFVQKLPLRHIETSLRGFGSLAEYAELASGVPICLFCSCFWIHIHSEVHNVWNLQLCRSACSSGSTSSEEINFNLLGFKQNELYPGWKGDETGHGERSGLFLAILLFQFL